MVASYYDAIKLVESPNDNGSPMETQCDLIFALPGDDKVLAALGAVTIRHGQLDYILRLTVGSVADVSQADVLRATDRQGSRELRDRIRKLAKRRFGESKTLVELDALLSRARDATEKRNKMIHILWAHELDGDPVVVDGTKPQSMAAPTAEELENLAEELHTITFDFIKARQDGFLRVALKKTGQA